MYVSRLAVPVCILALIVSGGSVLLHFSVLVVILLLNRLAVLFHCCFRLHSRLGLLLAGWMFLWHGMSPW
jgi:hypothetical protein